MQNLKNRFILPTSRFSQKISYGSGALWKYHWELTGKQQQNIFFNILTKIFDWPFITFDACIWFLNDTKIYPVNLSETTGSYSVFSSFAEILSTFKVSTSIYSCKSIGWTNLVKQQVPSSG